MAQNARSVIDTAATTVLEDPLPFLDAVMAIDQEFLREREDFIVATFFKLFDREKDSKIVTQLCDALNRASLYLKSVDEEFIEKMIEFALKHNTEEAQKIITQATHLCWFWKVGSADLIKKIESKFDFIPIELIGELLYLLGIVSSANPYLAYLVYPIMKEYTAAENFYVRSKAITALAKLGGTNEVCGRYVGEMLLEIIEKGISKRELPIIINALAEIKLGEKRVVKEGQIEKVDLITPATKFLCEQLNDEDINIRSAAIRALLSRVYEDKKGNITKQLILPALLQHLTKAKEEEIIELLDVFVEIHNEWPLPWNVVKELVALRLSSEGVKVKRINTLLKIGTRTPHLLETLVKSILSENLTTREKEELLSFMTNSPYLSKNVYALILSYFEKIVFNERYIVQQAYVNFATVVARKDFDTFMAYAKNTMDKLLLESTSEVIRGMVLKTYGELFTKRKELYPVLLESIIRELNRESELTGEIIPLLTYFARDPRAPEIVDALVKKFDQDRKRALRGIDLITAHAPHVVRPYLSLLIKIYTTSGRRDEILEISLILRNCRNDVIEYIEHENDITLLKNFKETLETVNFEGIGEMLAKIEAKLGI
ncbi:MAG: hypothetical protein QXL15_02550 [Candidatus Korarchaeota archaeon]